MPGKKKKSHKSTKNKSNANKSKELMNDHEEETEVQPTVKAEEGADSDGKKYNSIQELWDSTTTADWYGKANEYWKTIEPTIDGMLGGFSSTSKDDLRDSLEFITYFQQSPEYALPSGYAIVNSTIKDCGAGIGRITKNLLVNLFENVDILEQCPSFVEKAKTELSSSPKVKNFYCSGMQEFSFERKYDLIWIQWVIGHLTDSDFVSFFAKCKEALTPNGMIVLKDNNCSKGFIVDNVDSSVTRSDEGIRSLILQAGLKIIKVKLQSKWPKELFAVRMYAAK